MLLVVGQMSVCYLHRVHRANFHMITRGYIWDCAITVLYRADTSDMSSGDIPLVVYTGPRFSPFALLAVPRTDKVRQSPLNT